MKTFRQFLSEVKNSKPGLMKTGFIAKGFIPQLPGKKKN